MNHLARLLRLGFASLTLAGIAAITGCGGTAAQPAQPKPTVLNFAIASAEYSRALDRIVLVSPPSPPNAAEIHLLDGHTLQDEVILLGGLSQYELPTRVSVTSDGRHAVVGIDDTTPAATGVDAPDLGAVVYVDLAARRVITTYAMPSAVFEVAANDTTAFALLSPTVATNFDATVRAVDLATGTTVALSSFGTSVTAEFTRAAMSRDGKTLYLDCVAPSSPYQGAGGGAMLQSFTVNGAQLTPAATASPACYSAGALLQLSRDGSRVYTAAAVYSAALSKMHDAPSGMAIADPSNGQPVASITYGAPSVLLDLLDPSTFAQESETALPALSTDGGSVPASESGVQTGMRPVNHLHVFYDAAGTSRFVLLYWPGPDIYGIVSM
jgi:hypothetical protein